MALTLFVLKSQENNHTEFLLKECSPKIFLNSAFYSSILMQEIFLLFTLSILGYFGPLG